MTTPDNSSSAPTVAGGGLITINEVANRLGVNTRHIRRLVAEHRIPYIKWGHLLRFDPTHIDNWVAQHTITAQPARPTHGHR